MEQLSELTFKSLNTRIDALPEHSSVSMEMPIKSKYGYTIALVAFALCFLSLKVLPDGQLYSAIVPSIFLFVEILAIVFVVISNWPIRPQGFRGERMEYAEQLDHDLEHHTKLIEWLASFPRDKLAQLTDYAELRHERFREKLPLLTGSIEKLGVFPVLLGVFAQIKALHWPLDLSWIEIIFYFSIALLYWQCMLRVSARYRAQFFEMILKRALAAADKRHQHADVDV
jgi:hypothetical protein